MLCKAVILPSENALLVLLKFLLCLANRFVYRFQLYHWHQGKEFIPSFDELSFLSDINRGTASEAVTVLLKALTMLFVHVFGNISCNRATSSLRKYCSLTTWGCDGLKTKNRSLNFFKSLYLCTVHKELLSSGFTHKLNKNSLKILVRKDPDLIFPVKN